MRCVAICSALILLAASSAHAQSRLKRDDTPPATAAQPAAPQKNAKAPKRERAIRQAAPGSTAPVVDTRPRLKRDDMPAPVTAAAPAATGKKGRAHAQCCGCLRGSPARRVRRRARRTWRRAGRPRDHDLAIAGCTRVIEDAQTEAEGPRGRLLQSRQCAFGQGRPRAGDRGLRRGDQARSEERQRLQQSRQRAQRQGRERRRARRLQRGDQAEHALRVGLFQPRQHLCGAGRRARAEGLRRGGEVQPAQRQRLYRARRAAARLRRDREGARRHAPGARAGAQERLRGAVARHRGAPRQAEGRARAAARVCATSR